MIEFYNTKKQLTDLDLLELNLELPKEYKSHILDFNGGRPKKRCFKEFSIHYFHAIKYSDYPLEEILEDLEGVLPEGFFPIAEDGGGNQFCISLNKDNYGYIYMWYHDVDEEDAVVFLTTGFDEFIAGLTEEPIL